MSEMMTSGTTAPASSSASTASVAIVAACPATSRTSLRPSATSTLSSTMRILLALTARAAGGVSSVMGSYLEVVPDQFNLDVMFLGIVVQGDRHLRLLFPVAEEPGALARARHAAYRDDIGGLVVPIADAKSLPPRREQRADEQAIDFETQAKQGLDDEPVHPAGRARVPGPAPAPEVLRARIHVSCHDIRLDLVSGNGGRRVSVMNRIDEPEELPGAGGVASRRERHGGPHGGVGVLASILPDARQVALDVSRLQ